jgi:hypothetical protein
LISEREKMPFEVTPFLPFLAYYKKPDTSAPVAQPTKAEAKSQADPNQATPVQRDPQPQPQQ